MFDFAFSECLVEPLAQGEVRLALSTPDEILDFSSAEAADLRGRWSCRRRCLSSCGGRCAARRTAWTAAKHSRDGMPCNVANCRPNCNSSCSSCHLKFFQVYGSVKRLTERIRLNWNILSGFRHYLRKCTQQKMTVVPHFFTSQGDFLERGTFLNGHW